MAKNKDASAGHPVRRAGFGPAVAGEVRNSTVASGRLDAADLTVDRAVALALTPVSRETTERLDRFVAFLLERNHITNLIAVSTVPKVWTRHVADSLQLLPLGDGETWTDFGSGGGFPGMIIACAFAERPGSTIHLIESREKKADFLRAAVELLDIPAIVHTGRIEEIANQLPPIDTVTARALAPLPQLLAYIQPLVQKGAKGLLMKGQDVEAELTQASKYWKIQAKLVPSKTDPTGHIMIVSNLVRTNATDRKKPRDVRPARRTNF